MKSLPVDKEETIKFGKSSASSSGIAIFNDSSTLLNRAFSTSWFISLEKLIGSSRKFYHRWVL